MDGSGLRSALLGDPMGFGKFFRHRTRVAPGAFFRHGSEQGTTLPSAAPPASHFPGLEAGTRLGLKFARGNEVHNA